MNSLRTSVPTGEAMFCGTFYPGRREVRPCPGLLSFAPPGLSNSCLFVKFVSS